MADSRSGCVAVSGNQRSNNPKKGSIEAGLGGDSVSDANHGLAAIEELARLTLTRRFSAASGSAGL